MTEEYKERVKGDKLRIGQEMNNQTPRGSKEVSVGGVFFLFGVKREDNFFSHFL